MTVEIYSTKICPYCDRAKQLLQAKGIEYVEYFIDEEPRRRDEMFKRCDGRRTVPQIVIGNQAIGGFDDIKQLEQDGLLDALLTQDGENHG